MDDKLDPRLRLDSTSGDHEAGGDHEPRGDGHRAEQRGARAGDREPYGANAGVADQPAEPHLLDYLKVLHKRRWTVATAFSIVVLLVTVYSFTATPVYEASAKLLIESENPNVVSFKEVIDEGQARTDYYQTQYNIIQSRSLARRTLDTLKLWNHPDFGGKRDTKGVSLGTAVGAVTGTLKSWFGDNPTPESDETATQARAIDAYLDHLIVSPVRNSRIVDLRFTSTDPDLAAKIANTQAKGYIEQNLEYKFLSSKEASDWLGQRLAEQRKQLEAAETALQHYREQNDAISLEDRENITVQKLSDLNAAVTRAKTERIEKEAIYRQLQGLSPDSAALSSFPAILSNDFIQQQKSQLAMLQQQYAELGQKLGDRHPDMIRLRSAIQTSEAKIQGEVGKVVQSVKNEFLAAQAQEKSLTSALDAQKMDALAMNRKAIEYGVLQREMESAKQIYESLLKRAQETGISTELRTSNIRVIDQAERPKAPASPRRGLNFLLSIFGGGFLGVGLAFFFEYLDNRIKTPDDIRVHLGLPSLGLVPLLDAKAFDAVEPLISNGVPANFAEALRTLRTNVLFSSADEGMRAIAVTSTGPGEGKTMVASNLAVGFAQTGLRVLLIDADMRRPKIHEVVGHKQEPGLSNLMAGTAKASESVRKTKISGLWVLPAGRVPPNPAELLGSRRFRDFLGSLKEHFDYVVIDTPPVMAVADASVVANVVSGVVFVVGAEMTNRHAAQSALDQLERARARFVGAVLNRVDLQHNHYYYSQYYRKEYSRYYVSTGTR